MNSNTLDKKHNYKIGLALSGGGSRAIAFHLGCLRALNDRGILDRVKILSTVSGGSVIGAIYAYSDCPFKKFDEKIVKLLSKGFVRGISKHVICSEEMPKILGTVLFRGILSLLTEILSLLFRMLSALPFIKMLKTKLSFIDAIFIKKIKNFFPPYCRRASRTTAFASYLDENYFGGKSVNQIQRGNFELVINATELTTQTAIHFGSKRSWCWRFGDIVENIPVAKAVAASAAYPLYLPAIDEYLKFKKNDIVKEKRVIITDGGVYDNLGVDHLFSKIDDSKSDSIDFIITCIAGHGLPDGSARPYSWFTRMTHSYYATNRRPESMSKNSIHLKREDGKIKGFLMPFLGQLDERLEFTPSDFVSRDEVVNYPTDFFAMSSNDIEILSKRGEQQTNILIDMYHPEL